MRALWEDRRAEQPSGEEDQMTIPQRQGREGGGAVETL
jgi:hypothetical protein